MPIVRRTMREILKGGGGRVDWERLRATTDEDIDRMIAEDPDVAPDITTLPGPYRLVDPSAPDVRAIRRKLRLSQAQFAKRFGFSVRTIQEWEQGRALPDRPARILLRVIAKSPKTVARAVAEL
jgi:putative transcriptional regulator